jgi:hypothetical protein
LHFTNIVGKINRSLFGSNGSQPASRFVRSALADSSYTAHTQPQLSGSGRDRASHD